MLLGNLEKLFALEVVFASLFLYHLDENLVLELLNVLIRPKDHVIYFTRQIFNEIIPGGILATAIFVQNKRQKDMILPVIVQLFAKIFGMLLEKWLEVAMESNFCIQ